METVIINILRTIGVIGISMYLVHCFWMGVKIGIEYAVLSLYMRKSGKEIEPDSLTTKVFRKYAERHMSWILCNLKPEIRDTLGINKVGTR